MLSAPNRIVAALAAAILALAADGLQSPIESNAEELHRRPQRPLRRPSRLPLPRRAHFPLETTDPAKTKQLNTLVDAKLLDVAVERDIHASRYTPTAMGARVAPRFCYGHRVVTTIDSFTPPAPANGFPETQVAYHYTMEDVPVWAKSDAMRAAFPNMALDTSGTASDKATLAGTMAGWQVPD